MTSQVEYIAVQPGPQGNAVPGVVAMTLDANSVPQAASQANPVPIIDAFMPATVATWTSATPLNTAVSMNTNGYDQVVVTIAPPAGLTGGAVSFNVFDGVNWIPVKAARTDSYLTDSTFLLAGSPGTHAWQVPVAGFPQFQIALSSAIVGSGNVTVTTIVSSAPDVSIVTTGIDPQSLLPTMQASTTPNNLAQYRAFCPAATTPAAVKAAAGKVHKITCVNNAAAARYLKLFNLAAASVTVGTSVPFKTYLLPAGQATNIDFAELGLYFSTAITASVTGGFLDTDNTAPVANDVLTQIDYI